MEQVNVNDFFRRIIKLIKIKGTTQKDLHDNTLLKKNNFYYCKNNNTLPSIQMIISVAMYFNVSIDYLLWGKDHDFKDEEIVFLVKIRQMPDKNKETFYKILYKIIETFSETD